MRARSSALLLFLASFAALMGASNRVLATSIRFCPGLTGVHRGDTLIVSTSGLVCVAELRPAAPPIPTPPPVTPPPTQPPPVQPPPPTGTHEPSGMAQLASNQFTTIPPIGQSVRFESPWFINNGGGATRAASGAGLVYTYVGGVNQGGGSPATTYFDPASAPHTVYFRATITVSTPYTAPQNGHNKILYLGGIYLMLDGGTRLTAETEMSTDNANYPGTSTFALGIPHIVEWLVDQPNGKTQFWLDGVNQGSFAVKFQSGWSAAEPQIYGGFDSTAPAQTQTITYQNVYVSGK